MWSMTGAVGQRKMHRAQASDCAAIGRQRGEMHFARPAGRRSRTRPTSRIYFVTANFFETAFSYFGRMSGPDNLSKVERLLARDGNRCWLCDDPMDFKAEPGTANAPTKEHLLSQ